ncbi:MAG: NRDE family protein [Verrucomicrobiota bacterium]
MCTVSIFSKNQGVLLTMNRDERRTRLESPSPNNTDDCFFPTDSISAGTWCGLHRKGYALTLLNRYESESEYQGSDSRGRIIPEILELEKISEITRYMATPNLYRFSPFDLLVTDSVSVRHFSWNGEACQFKESCIDQAPFFYTSSSERTAEVVAYREALFENFKVEYPIPNPREVLSRFHGVRDTNLPRDGILVDRPEVHTMSICQIQISDESATLEYWPESDLGNCLKGEKAKAGFHKTFCRNLEMAK